MSVTMTIVPPGRVKRRRSLRCLSRTIREARGMSSASNPTSITACRSWVSTPSETVRSKGAPATAHRWFVMRAIARFNPSSLHPISGSTSNRPVKSTGACMVHCAAAWGYSATVASTVSASRSTSVTCSYLRISSSSSTSCKWPAPRSAIRRPVLGIRRTMRITFARCEAQRALAPRACRLLSRTRPITLDRSTSSRPVPTENPTRIE